MRLIDADALYERAGNLEAQALDYVGKLIERDGDEVSVEWKIWSAILTERTAFKHDVLDAPNIDAVEVVRCKDCIYCERKGYWKGCGQCQWSFAVVEDDDYCSKGERREQ